jgi:hypothetical protein
LTASKNRYAWGSESTHCLKGRSGNTSSTSSAAGSAMRRLLHEIRQRSVGRGAQLTERGIMLLDELVQERPFGSWRAVLQRARTQQTISSGLSANSANLACSTRKTIAGQSSNTAMGCKNHGHPSWNTYAVS